MNKKQALKAVKEEVKDLPDFEYDYRIKQYIPALGKIMDVGVGKGKINHKRRCWRKLLNAQRIEKRGEPKLKTSKRQQRLHEQK